MQQQPPASSSVAHWRADGVLDLKEGNVEDLARLYDVAVEGGSGTAKLPGLIVGQDIARQLGLVVGDVVSVISPITKPTAVGMLPRVRRFVVTGLFDSGMAEYDSSLVYMDLATAQAFFEMGETVTGIEVRTAGLYRAEDVAQRLRDELGFPFRVRSWMEVNHNLFSPCSWRKPSTSSCCSSSSSSPRSTSSRR
jgi:lipoprotein-releasing system permease protein